ncbi:MAG: 7-cyano-7-deazaguanine synthase [Candidatus Heimdallarchaeota archaeon LC_3]|nr:MAG: 7-cyano-7-deazaguanine synthase [Candidatus Heimdallarchaeota archaeon LC_3]
MTLNEKIYERAIVLLSGGMDSTTLLYNVMKYHLNIITLSFNYGQRHQREIKSAVKIAERVRIKHEIITIQIPKFVGSPLADYNTDIPTQVEKKQSITVVPFRNSLFLLQACAMAKFYKANRIYIAAVANDQLSYPDCRPKFFQAFQEMINAQEETDIEIFYPFVTKSKIDIVKLGQELGVPWEDTWSCYQGLELPCETCDACKERIYAFESLNLKDPLKTS